MAQWKVTAPQSVKAPDKATALQTARKQVTVSKIVFTPPPPPPPSTGLFSADSPWNAKLADNAPLESTSDALASTFNSVSLARGAFLQSASYSTPLWIVPANQPRVPVKLDSWRSGTPMQTFFNEGVPIPANAKQAAGSDGHMTVWQPSTDQLWEFWVASKQADGWHAQTGGGFKEVSKSPGYYSTASWPPYSDHSWGATGTSLPVIGGTTLKSEWDAGVIPHALAIDLPDARGSAHAFPAQQHDGSGPDSLIPEGAKIRFPANINLSGLTTPQRIVATALRDYGGIIRDRTGSATGVYFEDRVALGESDPFASISPWNFLFPSEGFPWSQIQVLKTKLCTGECSPP